MWSTRTFSLVFWCLIISHVTSVEYLNIKYPKACYRSSYSTQSSRTKVLTARHIVEKTLRLDGSGSSSYYYRCKWKITAPKGKVIQARMADSYNFYTYRNSECNKNHLKFHDPSYNRTFTICGGSTSMPSFTTEGNVLDLSFYATKQYYSGTYKFTVNYLAVAPKPKPPVTIGSKCSANGLTISNQSGIIESPKDNTGIQISDTKVYYGRYKNNDICVWHLKAHSEQSIHINFTKMDIGSLTTACGRYKCLCDYVEIFNPKDDTRKRFCYGTTSDLTYKSSELYVSFVSDSKDTYSGFALNYTFTPKMVEKGIVRPSSYDEYEKNGNGNFQDGEILSVSDGNSTMVYRNTTGAKEFNSSAETVGKAKSYKTQQAACNLIYNLWTMMCT